MDNNFIENELIILTKQTIDKFLETDNPSELISLYLFYYYTSKWQKTNQIKSTTGYTAKGLHWNKDKVRKYKNILKDMGLINDIQHKDKETKKIKGWYIKINYIFRNSTIELINHPPQNPECGKTQSVEKRGTNALSTNSLNALSANIESEHTKERIKKTNKRNCLKWVKENPPLLKEIKEYAKLRNLIIDCEWFHDYFTDGDWIDSNGKKVYSWKQKMQTLNKFQIEKNKDDLPPSIRFKESYENDDN